MRAEERGESTEENEGKSSGGGRVAKKEGGKRRRKKERETDSEREREKEGVQTLIRDSIIELSQGGSFRLHFQLFAGKRSANTGYSR
mgnify:CR=1 FL=1